MNLLAPPLHRLERRDPGRRQAINSLFVVFCVATAGMSIAVLVLLLTSILLQGRHYLSWVFLTSFASPDAAEAGILAALSGTIWVAVVCAILTLPVGVATAIFLEEFKPKHRVARSLHGFVQLNITNLAGVPSVVYGILGLTAFVSMFGLFGTERSPAWEIGVRHFDQFESLAGTSILVPATSRSAPAAQPREGMTAYVGGKPVELHVLAPTDAPPADDAVLRRTVRQNAESGRLSPEKWYYFRLPFGRTIVTGALTLMLVILPIVIVASQEALRAVPDSLREAALGMGCTRWQMVRRVTLPASLPGIMTGSILAMSRAIGEAAPILIIAGVVYKGMVPSTLMDGFTVMPLQIFDWAVRPQIQFHHLAASGIVVLLAVLLLFNAAAIAIRQYYQRPLS